MENVLTTYTLLTTLFFILLMWYLRFHLKRKRMYELAEQYSGPRALPIIGNILEILVPLTDFADRILTSCSHYKSPTRLWFGPHLSVQIWDPENAKIVLNSPHALTKQPYLYGLLEYASGRGLITSPVDEWKRHRKLIAPVFNQKHLESFFDIFDSHSKKLVESIRCEVDKGVFNAHDYFVKYALNSVMDTILDFTEDSSSSVDARTVIGWFQTMEQAMAKRMTTVWYYPEFIFKLSASGKKLTQDKTSYDQYMTSLIQKWEEHTINKLPESTRSDNKTEGFKPMKLMDHLLSISDGSGKFSAEELHGEVVTIVSAGMETTSATIGYIMMMLGIYPKVQEKVYEEIKQTLGTKKQLQYEDLKKLVYLERVIKETLRFFPGITGVARYNDREIQLTNNIIPAYTSIAIAITALHHDPNMWPNPTKFDPDRFLPEEEAKRHPYSYMPFSAGPRNCVGIRFAYVSLKVAVSTLILNYKVNSDYKTVDDIHLTMQILLKPTDGYKIRITSR